MIAQHLKPKHIGRQFRARADGAPLAVEGGLSDYALKKNRDGKLVAVIVWINGQDIELRPDSSITPIEGAEI